MRLKPLKLTHMHAKLQELSEREDPAGWLGWLVGCLGCGCPVTVLTQYDNQANEYGAQGAHAELQTLSLLHQFTVLAPIALGANAAISQTWLQIDARAPVQAGHVQAFVAIDTALGIR